MCDQAAVASSVGSTRAPFSNLAPERTSTTRRAPVIARRRPWADLNQGRVRVKRCTAMPSSRGRVLLGWKWWKHSKTGS